MFLKSERRHQRPGNTLGQGICGGAVNGRRSSCRGEGTGSRGEAWPSVVVFGEAVPNSGRSRGPSCRKERSSIWIITSSVEQHADTNCGGLIERRRAHDRECLSDFQEAAALPGAGAFDGLIHPAGNNGKDAVRLETRSMRLDRSARMTREFNRGMMFDSQCRRRYMACSMPWPLGCRLPGCGWHRGRPMTSARHAAEQTSSRVAYSVCLKAARYSICRAGNFPPESKSAGLPNGGIAVAFNL